MSMGDAALKYLKIARKKKSGAAIAEALEVGGFQHASKNFNNSLNTALYRLAGGDDPIQVRVGREWGLREWYPGWRRKVRGEEEEEEPET